jgi:hypothetical protein
MARKPSIPQTETPVTQPVASKKVASKRHKKATPAVAEAEPLSEPSLSATVAAPTKAAKISLDPNEVARLAYSYWVSRNYQHGSPVEDWFRAENELRQRASANR